MNFSRCLSGGLPGLIFFLVLQFAPALWAGIIPLDLRCGSWENPLGIDETNPRLSWRAEATAPGARNRRPTAYQILVASSPALLQTDRGDLWDSGKVASDQSGVAYGGTTLKSSQQVFWKVRIWDRRGRGSAWSSVANWTMGLLNPADWRGNWLAATPNGVTNSTRLPLFRREFVVRAGLQRALIHICGLGQYELSANGRKVGDNLLSPGWTKYDRTCLYDTLDLAPYLTQGTNAIGVMLGNGIYNIPPGERYAKFRGSFGPPKLIAQIELFYTNGSSEIIPTDPQWLTAPGPITFSSVYGGEDEDARLEPAHWNQAGFDASAWQSATVTHGPGGILRGASHAAPPIKAIETLSPIRTNYIARARSVYDLGQNASIMLRLTVEGEPGAVVRVIPAELTNTDGTVNRSSCGGGLAYWQYTLAGGGREVWVPHFFYHGSRYLQVRLTAAPGSHQLPRVDSLQGVVIQSASAPVGSFACSSELFNRINQLIRWAQRNNIVSVLTDCPHRERLGWLEQYHLNGPSLRYNFDLDQLYAKTMGDMADSQTAAGLVPDIAPEYTVFKNGYRDSPEWGSACILVPWQQYLWSGEDTLLRQYYGTMTKYLAYLQGKATNNMLAYGLGDWFDRGPGPLGEAQLTPLALTATAFYYQDAHILADTATLLGRTNDAVRFAALAANIRLAFNDAFYNATNGSYATGSQTAQALPLVMNLVEPQNRDQVVAALVANVRSQGLTAGDIGHRYLLRALADAGRSDVVFDLHSQTNQPGYGYILNRGATSLTEGWDGSFSQDHFMLGQIMEWFYHDLAGIQPDPAGPGFARIIIKPAFVGGITWVQATNLCIRGAVISDWALTNNSATLNVTIPVGSTARVYLPLLDTPAAALMVTESGTTIWQGGKVDRKVSGVTFDHMEHTTAQTYMVWSVGSGDYRFSWNATADRDGQMPAAHF
jgi:hypothetical protein